MPKKPPIPPRIARREYAVRLANGRKRKVFVHVHAPVLFLPDEFVCALKITGLTKDPIAQDVHGADEVQALELGLIHVGRLLMASRAFKEGRLERWDKPVDRFELALPMELASVMSLMGMLRDTLRRPERTEKLLMTEWRKLMLLHLDAISGNLRAIEKAARRR